MLHNFLRTFTSRYSDFDGYWVFGVVVEELNDARIDLLGPADRGAGSAPMRALVHIARDRFRNQLAKHRLTPSLLKAAELLIARAPEKAAEARVNGRGYEVTVSVRAVTDLDTEYVSSVSIFVAPHDPNRESRSKRRAPPIA